MCRLLIAAITLISLGWAVNPPVWEAGVDLMSGDQQYDQVQFQATPMPFVGPVPSDAPVPEVEGQVHGLYFYAEECPHCQSVFEEVIKPLQDEFGVLLDMRMLKVDEPECYELLINAEEICQIAAGERGLPTLMISDQILIDEEEIKNRLPDIVRQAIAAGGLDWPDLPCLDPQTLSSTEPEFSAEGICSIENPEACETDAPINAVYFYQVGCQSCSRVEADLNYLHSLYPQLIVEVYNIYDQADLGNWLATRAGRSEDLYTPALFLGDFAWIGEDEITPAAVQDAIEHYELTGAEKFWVDFEESQGESGMLERFRSMSWLTVVFAGLIDGLNPCAFATLIFFVSYLTLSGRKGKEVLSVGLTFTAGVFLAYLGIGLGFYKVLDLFGSALTILGRWVYGLTAALCFGLAIFTFIDFIKVRRGGTSDMGLKLPHKLRMRINAIIRKGRTSQAYIAGAFVTGVIISFLELACTGQIYLPTIIFVSSIPELRPRAVTFLVLYNLLFTLPLIVVFIFAYYGTTSKDLSCFLERHAAVVKLGMVMLFLSLGSWLTFTLLA